MAENFGNYNSTYEEEVSLAYCLMTYDKKQNDYTHNDGETLKYP